MKAFRKILSVLLCLTILSGLFTIGITNTNAGSTSTHKLTIKVGDTYQLWVDPSGSWTVSDKSVADIDKKGLVHAYKKGTSTLTFNNPDALYTEIYYVTVEDVKLNKTSLTLTVGQTATLFLDNKSGQVTWSSKNAKIASVSSSGNVKAVSAGSTKITAKLNGKSYTCSVTVKAKPISMSKAKLTLTVGDSASLKLNNAKGTIKWKSSSKAVTVSSKGVVTAKKSGSAVITATYKGKAYKCKITVKAKKINSLTMRKALALKKGEKLKLTIKKAKASKIKWSIKNKKIATVSKGVITGKKSGSTTVTAKYGKKTYKCSVRVFDSKNLGSKSVTYKNNSATISKIKVAFDPSSLGSSGKVTINKVSGLPKLNGTKMNTYDFSVSGAKVTKNNVAVLEIPQKLKKNQIPVAGYFNEKTSSWEPVCCSYKNGKITIIANHFSSYGVGAISKPSSWYVYNDNTTTEKVLSYWTPDELNISGEEALKIVSNSIKTSSIPSQCAEWGWDKFNALFDNTVNWKTNLFDALGVHTKLTKYIADHTKTFGAIGFALAYISAIKYAYEGNHQMAAYTAFNGFSGAVTAAFAAEIGTATMSACCFAITVITYMFTETYSQSLDANEKKWYNYYKYYYSHENPRKPHQWKDILLPILESGKSTSTIQKQVEAEIDKYVDEAWNSSWFAMYFYEATGMSFGVSGGLSKAIMNKLSAEYKDELMNGDIALVYEWYSRKLQKDIESSMEKSSQKLIKELNQTFKISFYDSSLKKGKKSSLAGWTVRWKNIPSKIKDKKNLNLTLNSKGQANTEYTLFAAMKYNIKPTVELVNLKGKVKRTITYKINSANTKVDVAIKSASSGSPTWRLTSTSRYTIGYYIDEFPTKNAKVVSDTYVTDGGSSTYKFTKSGNSIITALNNVNSLGETNSYTIEASVSQPPATIAPGKDFTLNQKVTLKSKSDGYMGDSGPSLLTRMTVANPVDEDCPQFAWASGNVGRKENTKTPMTSIRIDPNSKSSVAGASVSAKTDFTAPSQRTFEKNKALQTGDVFYLAVNTNKKECHSYIVYKYTYK